MYGEQSAKNTDLRSDIIPLCKPANQDGEQRRKAKE